MFSTTTGTQIITGILFCSLLGYTLPTDPSDYMDDEMWRITYAFPFLISAFLLIL